MNNLSLPQAWTVDPMHTTLMFSVRHLMITNVRGVFEDVRGLARYDAQHPELTSIDIEVPAASIQTRQAQRDAHLRGPDFFAADAHPTIAFRSTRAEVEGGRLTRLAGDLTIRGITRELVLTVDEVSAQGRDHNGLARIGGSASGRILRSDFGMTYNRVIEAGRLATSDEVVLRLDVSLVQDAAAAAAQAAGRRSMIAGDVGAQPG